jgi:hypothetical protein
MTYQQENTGQQAIHAAQCQELEELLEEHLLVFQPET